ncbi:MAG: tRNA lysidine(34) synthetase TilS [Lactobacillus sp.]|nr:tRNA lysidine(34) synthetase TilS [Lactobacillus sp.]MCH3905843.1 tRNA lysidine(34) synthetase TilS [Lactobacillus sp.]MCH3990575.1 tRNA lysidine(34) synthetase TilS [Lactobacillus sp.]MCH4068710.1 tRNA lysidine(34) synthetase TilS [Lactobacillus sp.]MCI1303805.1 tRNA lysidine(34) synthetase TilS [Lactobacillus sp.]
MKQPLPAALQALGLSEANKTIVVAASAGPDSMALLEMTRRLPNVSVVAAHFDHQLRADSVQETKLLQTYCRKHELTLITAKWPIADQPEHGIEAAARTARYRFLDRVCQQTKADYLFTAHHGDDLLENILLKLLRSGYPREMNSLPAVSQRQNYLLVRPLLAWSKEELADYDRVHQLAFVIDETNSQAITLRNQLRLDVVPTLKKMSPDLLTNANRFASEMSQLAAERSAYFGSFASAKLFVPGVLIAPVTDNRDYYAWLVEQTWQRQVNFQASFNQHDFEVLFYGQRAFVVNKNKIPLIPEHQQPIKVGQPFTFAGQKWVLATRLNKHEVDYFYGPQQADWSFGSLASNQRLQTAAGHLVKPKKYSRLPAQLRPLCLTIFNGATPWFVRGTYRWQEFSESYIRYSVQALLK